VPAEDLEGLQGARQRYALLDPVEEVGIAVLDPEVHQVAARLSHQGHRRLVGELGPHEAGPRHPHAALDHGLAEGRDAPLRPQEDVVVELDLADAVLVAQALDQGDDARDRHDPHASPEEGAEAEGAGRVAAPRGGDAQGRQALVVAQGRAVRGQGQLVEGGIRQAVQVVDQGRRRVPVQGAVLAAPHQARDRLWRAAADQQGQRALGLPHQHEVDAGLRQGLLRQRRHMGPAHHDAGAGQARVQRLGQRVGLLDHRRGAGQADPVGREPDAGLDHGLRRQLQRLGVHDLDLGQALRLEHRGQRRQAHGRHGARDALPDVAALDAPGRHDQDHARRGAIPPVRARSFGHLSLPRGTRAPC